MSFSSARRGKCLLWSEVALSHGYARPVPMRVSVPVCVGAALRIERRLDRGDLGAEPGKHLGKHVVGADQDLLRFDRGGHMAVAEVPGKPREVMRVLRRHHEQRLGPRAHLDHAAVFEHQPVAMPERGRFGEIEQELQPALAFHREAAAMPVVIGEKHRVDRGAAPMPGADDFRSADHVRPTLRPLDTRNHNALPSKARRSSMAIVVKMDLSSVQRLARAISSGVRPAAPAFSIAVTEAFSR